jgi:hypothetical protein
MSQALLRALAELVASLADIEFVKVRMLCACMRACVCVRACLIVLPQIKHPQAAKLLIEYENSLVRYA